MKSFTKQPLHKNYEQAEKILRLAVFPLLLAIYIVQVYVQRGLYADGGNFFLELIWKQNLIFFGDYQRSINHFITMFPGWVAIKLGFISLEPLRYFCSGWMIFCTLGMWTATLWHLRKDILFWPMAWLFCLVYFNSSFYILGEYNLCFALSAYCFACLSLPVGKDTFSRYALLVAAACLPFNYAASLFLGPVLIAKTLLKPKAEWQEAPIFYRYSLVALFALSVLTALWEVLAPLSPSNFSRARNLAVLFEVRQYWFLMIIGLIITVPFFVSRPLIQWSLAALGLILSIPMMLDSTRFFPVLQFAMRAPMAVTLACGFVALWMFQKFALRQAVHNPLLPAITGFGMLAMFSVFDVQISIKFNHYIEDFRQLVNSRTGLIDYEKSDVQYIRNYALFNWAWTHPLLSLILREDESKSIILNHSQLIGYQPFDPLEFVPDLTRYYHPHEEKK